jgi:uncharacterized protein YebE (UPF0316 family)
METGIILGVVVIFLLRVVGVTLSTIRVLMMTRGKKYTSAVLGFFEVLVYVLAIGTVVQDLTNIPNLLSYCLGFSVGTLLGMWLEERIALGYVKIHVVSPGQGFDVAQALRREGFGATEGLAVGKDGTVGTVETVIRRRNIETACTAIYQIAPDAFVTIDEIRSIQHGYLRTARHAQ